jgi:uncharacterized protein
MVRSARSAPPPAGDESWLYVLLRRILLFLEHSLDRALQWAGFEPNDGGWKRRVRRR